MTLVLTVGCVALIVGLVAGRWWGLRSAAVPGQSVSHRAASVEPPGPSAGAASDRTPALERFQEHALAALPWGVLVTDQHGRVVFLNPVARAYERPRHSDTLVQATLRQLTEQAVSGEAVIEQIDLYGPPRRSLKVRALPIRADQGVAGAVLVLEDVTSAEEIERLRKDFVANVSHELRTPVGAIGLLAETLIDTDDPAVITRLTGRLHTEALRAGDLIDDLLTLSTVDLGRIENAAPVDCRTVIAEAVTGAGVAAERRGITVQTQILRDHPMVVEGDAKQLASAVTNLVDNAIKYSPEGETVTVSCQLVHDEVVITVEDNGVGIPRAAQPRIFERFYRVDDARRRSTGGTGLGLSIVRRIVINHRGVIDLESTEGVGSRFTVRLPSLDIAVERTDP